MRRLLPTAALAIGLLLIAAPAQAFAHDRVANPYFHALLDLLTLAVVLSPIVTAFTWGPHHKASLIALIAIVQLPVAIIGFVPIVNPLLHLALFVSALGLTAASIRLARRARQAEIGVVEQ